MVRGLSSFQLSFAKEYQIVYGTFITFLLYKTLIFFKEYYYFLLKNLSRPFSQLFSISIANSGSLWKWGEIDMRLVSSLNMSISGKFRRPRYLLRFLGEEMVPITDSRCLQEAGCCRHAHAGPGLRVSDADMPWKDLIIFLLKAAEGKHAKYDALNELFLPPHKRI